MDQDFPKFVRVLLKKLDFLGIPNLGLLIAGLAVLAFVAQMGMGTQMGRFIFDPYLIMQGEWWRLFAFPTGLENPIWLFFYVIYVYYVVGTLEESWGAGPLTIFIGLSYIAAAAGSFLTGMPVSIWYYVLQNVSLAFGTVFPEVTFHLFLILPVKAKWLAMLAGAFLVLQLVLGTVPRIFLVVSIFPYLLFFGPMLYRTLRYKVRGNQRRKKFEEDMWR